MRVTESGDRASALDDRAALAAADPSGMLDAVESSVSLWRDALAGARGAGLPSWGPRPIVVAGMGGSGISGDVLAAVAATRADHPVVVTKGFDLPRWAGPGALVVSVSYSGNTEEALACFDEAIVRGCDVVAVTAGGALADRAAAAGAPLVRVAPSGLMPRAAFPALAASLLAIGERAGAVPDLEEESVALLRACEEGLSRWGSAAPSAGNEAKGIAAAVAGTRPHVWGQEGVLAVAAMRWKTQFNENAKMNASWAVLPESLHNEIVTVDESESFVVLRAGVERERIAAAVDVLSEYRPLHAWSIGTSDLATLASAVLLGDLVTVYAALLRGVDPTPVDPIMRFKRALG